MNNRQLPITRPAFDKGEVEAVARCLESGWVTQGPLTEAFEGRFAQVHSVEHALATTSCTAALHLATLALGLGPGDEVIVPAFTWVTSAHAAEYVGARSVLVDVDERSFNMDIDAFEAAIGPSTRAVVVVHLFGQSAPMDDVLRIARKNNLHVIEDAACAIGTSYRGRPVGGLGDVGCFSFHPRKVITTGEGGMVTTHNADLAGRIRSLRNHGATGIPTTSEDQGPWTMATFDILGFNLRLSDIQAAVGLVQFEKLEFLLNERRRLARQYVDALTGLPDLAAPPVVEPGHTFQSFVVRVIEGGRSRRNHIMKELATKGIQTRPGTHAVHRLGYYRERYGLRAEEFPVAARCEDTTITLPLFPGMRDDEVERVAQGLSEAVTSRTGNL
jgi:dTDP-4-amino-4,6-dideoxygalactose transaminase